jgi:hypothetical protein
MSILDDLSSSIIVVISAVILRDKECCWVCGLEIAFALQVARLIPRSAKQLVVYSPLYILPVY